jgi:hypothetical protein
MLGLRECLAPLRLRVLHAPSLGHMCSWRTGVCGRETVPVVGWHSPCCRIMSLL